MINFIKASFFVFYLLLFGIQLNAAPQKDRKEQLYVIVPGSWKNTEIEKVFTEQAIRIDSSATGVMPQVKRLGFAGKKFHKIPFSPSQFPNLEQVLIGEYQDIPEGLENIPKLKSLIVACEQINPQKYYEQCAEDWCHVTGSYRTDSVLSLLTNLEEIYLPGGYHPIYLSEKTLNNSLKKINGLELEILSGSFFYKQRTLRVNMYLFQEYNPIPYPEMALLASVNPELIHSDETFKEYASLMLDALELDSFQQLPFPLSPSIGKPVQIIKPVRRNGEFLVKYDNGVNLAQGYFKEGKPHGKWLFWYIDGTVCEERYYENGVEINNWIIYDYLGDTIRQLQFEKKGTLKYRLFYLHQNQLINSYNEPRPTVERIFYLNIQTEKEIQKEIKYPTYIANDTVTEINTRFWYKSNGIEKMSINQEYYINQLLSERVCTTFFALSDTSLRYRCTKTNHYGEVEQFYHYQYYYIDSIWYGNKKLKSVITDYYQFHISEWDENGILIRECIGTDQNLKECKIFFTNGRIKEKSTWIGNEQHGLTLIYNESGEVICKRRYANGKLIWENDCKE